MFRRKEEGTDEMFQQAPTDVQVPPSPQAASSTPETTEEASTVTTAATPVATAPTSSDTTTPASVATGYAAPAAAGYGAKPAAGAAPASPYRAAAPSTASTSSNVTDIANRNRFADSNRTSNTTLGSLGMDKNVAKSGSKNRVLTVGNDILMKGEINSCDRIVIEGAVDATLKDVHTMEIAETGSFKGIAEVEEAEISGTVEGDLIVRGRLIIYASGKVTGKIAYGEIEIERGGQLQGEIKTVETSASKAKVAA